MARCAIVVALLAGTTQADVFKFQEVSGNAFHEPDNWLVLDSNGNFVDPPDDELPDDDDRIIVPGGLMCEVVEGGQGETEWTVDTITVEETGGGTNGELEIDKDITLTLENDDSNCGVGHPQHTCPLYDHVIDGVVEIVSDREETGVLSFTSSSHEIGGDGRIVGTDQDEDGESTIEIWGTSVTSYLDGAGEGVRGDLAIVKGPTASGASIFRNEGLVTTENRGWIRLGPSVDLEDVSGAAWVAKDSCNRLIFQREELCLKGDIIDAADSASVLQFEADIATTGTFERNACGNVDLDVDDDGTEDATFSYSSFSTSGACSNPANTTGSWCESGSGDVAEVEDINFNCPGG